MRKKDNLAIDEFLVWEKYDLFQFLEEYQRVSGNISQSMDNVKIRARRYTNKDAKDLYTSLMERQSLSREFLKAIDEELRKGYSRFDQEDLEILSNDLFFQMSKDECFRQSLEESLDYIPLRPHR